MTVFLLLVLTLVLLVLVVFLLGYRMGTEGLRSELIRVRLEAAEAERSLHELVKSAWVAMAEEAEQLRGRP